MRLKLEDLSEYFPGAEYCLLILRNVISINTKQKNIWGYKGVRIFQIFLKATKIISEIFI